MNGWVLWASLSKDIISIIERYAFKSMHRDRMKRNYVLEDIRGYKRPTYGIEFVNSENLLHRDGDKPAVILSNGTKAWYKEGKVHREGDLPAIIYSNGTKEWYKKGKLHRDGDLPAIIIHSNGDEWWYKEGKI